MIRYVFLAVFAVGSLAAAAHKTEIENWTSRFFGSPPAMKWETIEARCTPSAPQEQIVYGEEFHWNYSLAEMKTKYEEIYSSGKRLYRRAYYDPARESFILPLDSLRGGDVVLSRRAILSIRRHIETALAKGYVHFVFFPDMGHSHFFVPQRIWTEKYASIPVSKTNTLYEQMFADPNLKVLYHTAEQLKTLDENKQPLADRDVQWRFYTRNIVGDNEALGALEVHRAFGPGNPANTVREYPGHREWSAGFNVSASKDGCFPFTVNGRTSYFDLSLFDLPRRDVYSRKRYK